MKVLIIGASRGIGLELAKQYRAENHAVLGTVRSEEASRYLHDTGAAALRLDVTSAESCGQLTATLDGERFDLVYLNAGVFGPRLREFETPTQSDFDHVMHTNVLGPMRLLPLIPDLLAPGARVVIVSSRMGSMALRTEGHAWLYRASKAALNSVMKDASLILGARAVCVALHPGWVRTDMGGAQADLSVQQSVTDIRRTVSRLGAADNGSFLNHDGTPLAW
ncbi:MAG: SDR family oxidoreductase [Rubrivivax sp.]|jgi:NAD(P)-dependent dehydrogenase (short-subunit alcohol dehydrogenase family)|nr:SDR family oxidoreductase [Rubrivivax sp.]